MQQTNCINRVEDKILDEETIESLLKSEEDIKMGRTRKATEVIKEFEEKYGFPR